MTKLWKKSPRIFLDELVSTSTTSRKKKKKVVELNYIQVVVIRPIQKLVIDLSSEYFENTHLKFKLI